MVKYKNNVLTSMYWLIFNVLMGVGIFAPLLIAKRKRESNTFLRSDLISGTASVIIFSLAYMMTWNPVMGLIASLVLMIPLSVKSAEPGKLLISLFKKLLPNSLRNHVNNVAIVLSALFAFLVISLTYQVTPPVMVILEVYLVVAISIFALSKFGNEPLKSFIKSNILAKQNRTAVAIAIGSAAIVFAVVMVGVVINQQAENQLQLQEKVIRNESNWRDCMRRTDFNAKACVRYLKE